MKFFPLNCPNFLHSTFACTKHRTSQIKYIVKVSVTRRSSYDTGGIPTLDGDTQTLEQKLEWIAARQWRQQCGDQCLGKMSLPLLPEPPMSRLQVEQNSRPMIAQRCVFRSFAFLGVNGDCTGSKLMLDAGGLWLECLDM